MSLRRFILMLIALAFLPSAAHAETVTLKDGTVRIGTILDKNDQTITMKVNQDGITATVVLNTDTVATISYAKPTPSVAVTPATNPTASGNPKPTTRPLPPPAELKTPGFLVDLAESAVGRGLDDPTRLPPAFLSLWNKALAADKAADLASELDALRSLDSAFSAAPHGMDRLNAITTRERQELFGQWLAEVHIAYLAATMKNPILDLSDVRDSERAPLIGVLKERTPPALDALKTYFPPVDDKTGRYTEFHPAQLQGITISNALEVKHDATYALAILLAQIKLQPQMPAIDRQLMSSQLQNVQHILSRANELEPAAKAAAAQAARKSPATLPH